MPQTMATMPPEVVQLILKNTSPPTQLAFISTCKALYRMHSLDVLLVSLQHLANRKPCALLALAPKKTLVRRRVEYDTYSDAEETDSAEGSQSVDETDSDAGFHSETDDSVDTLMAPGSIKYKTLITEDWVIEPSHQFSHALVKPFVVLAAAYNATKDDIVLQVAFPEYQRSGVDVLEVTVDGPNVFLSPDFEESVQALWVERKLGKEAPEPDSDSNSDSDSDSERPRRLEVFTYSYNEAMKTGGFFERIKSSDAMRRWWMYNCWECRGKRCVCPGCGGFRDRWPLAAGNGCGYDMPCPMCVGYQAAQYAKWRFAEGDVRTVDEEVSVAPVSRSIWYKEQWEANNAGKDEHPETV